MTAADVLAFWFTETPPARWFEKNDAFDALLRERFLDTYWRVVRGETEEEWRTSADGRLAEIIVLDQFARNMFRGTPQAFAMDPLALALAQASLRAGDGAVHAPERRAFLYLPFMHSESLMMQEKCVRLFEAHASEEHLKFAREHRDIIRRFGRFPHRNSILGRPSSDEEREFLTMHAGF